MEGHVMFVPPSQHSPAYILKLADLFGSVVGSLLQYERLKLPDPMYVHVEAPLRKKDCNSYEEMQVPVSRFMKLPASAHPCGAGEAPQHAGSNQSG